ncbi:hypothetical protein KFK09_024483 [Dendrobium nobile]|uniref:Ubiquitin-like protease family profile domain-containing protein n=1 Tax=Dendrobium nobile TaxID=94219 RepID=A0A8T3ADY9_DENNO|nr:hypothetical protein KFK09_024483 [Dendrobium nobile]
MGLDLELEGLESMVDGEGCNPYEHARLIGSDVRGACEGRPRPGRPHVRVSWPELGLAVGVVDGGQVVHNLGCVVAVPQTRSTVNQAMRAFAAGVFKIFDFINPAFCLPLQFGFGLFPANPSEFSSISFVVLQHFVRSSPAFQLVDLRILHSKTIADIMPEGYTPKIHFRCRTSGFREVCDELVEKFGDQFVSSLSELQINQFLLLPRFPQNVPMVYMLLSTWDNESESFVINSRSLTFTSEEIALIIGLPNRVQSSSRTKSTNKFDEVSKTVEKIIDEIVGKKETSEDEEFTLPSSGTGGIARRVHGRNDRKRKRVKTPFTTGDRKKKKTQLQTVNKEAEILSKKETSVTTRKPVTRAATRLKEKVTESKKASAPQDETTKIAPSAAPVKKPKTAIFDVEDSKYVERAAKEFLDYPGRLLLNEEKRNTIDAFLKKYTKMEDTIFAIGDAIIFRSQMDELLLCEELDTNHMDTFAYLLSEKNKMVPGLNQPFLYVSAFHWGYYVRNKQEKTTSFADNITKDAVKNANIMFVPIIYERHWTLLVANMKNKRWDFMDSLPKATHKSITPEVVYF